ncbi:MULTISPECIES: hypothetical protein [Sphingobium]|uniref:Uncharacterized protein n=1 Tax=Sphingobium chungbukense TaxID=56193 RepID=A0A0M3APN0_9SPHN|nr:MULTISPECIES: hypothetical protein [Sphingobium]KKW92147.1 hypothetical protein YP76_09350 [Sphingobium chungbukense]PJG48998.1 hypothetical protein CAF53_12720 [Sphingobium sp. LB126]
MKKKTAQPPVKGSPPRKSSLLKKAARVGATVVAARVAADTGKKGVIGLLAGMGAKRLIMRYPAGALFVTGAYMAGKLYEAKREADRKRKTNALPDKSAQPILIEEARKARKG